MSRFTSDDASRRGKAGRARANEITAENAAEIAQLTARLIGGLGRPATGAETLQAEIIAATAVRSRRLRAKGKDDTPQRRLLVKLMEGVFGTMPAPSPAEEQRLTPDEAARCFQPAAPGDECDRAPVVNS